MATNYYEKIVKGIAENEKKKKKAEEMKKKAEQMLKEANKNLKGFNSLKRAAKV